KRIERTGFGQFLFYDWRFRDDQSPNPDFELNDPKFSGATILVSRRNFGSGSSREHAPWALEDYGFRVIIAESFADIFFNNCFKNGMLPITLPEEKIEVLFERTAGQVYTLHVDLREQRLYDDEGLVDWQFEVDAFRKHCLLQGLDDIALTLEHEDAIAAYERSAGMDPAIER
ncbi:MAG: 3-isopropylmalate dehydratase small subunit, partial [Planctomycetota bacterium]|nr:3-isopropylmalate dehydratase small subunit [Planctomycetota bacterium]